MYIQPNILLTPTEKLIKPYECSFIVIEGPNMKAKLSLEGLEIKYDSFYLSQLVLNQKSNDQPLMYGFLGENVTFLMIRAKYMPLDPNWAIETDQYIQYYFKDDPVQIRTMGQMLLLTGNSTNRIPQIFFNNPSSLYKVYLEVLMANLPQNDLINTQQYSQNSNLNGLYWNSIISDVVYYNSPTSTGSTQLEIIDTNDNKLLIIPYNNIRTINKINSNTLLIGLDTEEKIKLEFLSDFNCDQANSRINWVLKSQRYRILTKNSPDIDIISPQITLNDVLSGTTTGITSGVTEIYLLPSGTTYTSDNIKEIFINSIIDNFDGVISIYDSNLEIYQYDNLIPLTEIIDVGTYNIIISVKDIANNISRKNIILSIYSSESNGVFNSGIWSDDSNWSDLDIWVD